jgi:ATP-dependent helicase HrpB
MAAPIDRAVLQARFPDRFVQEEGAAFDARTGAVLARRRLRFGPLVLEEQPLAKADPAAVAAALATAVAERGLRDLPWTAAARQLQARLGWMRRVEGDSWPDAGDAALAATVQDWLAPHLHGRSRLTELAALNLPDLLLSGLPWAQRQRLDAVLPARLPLPGGRVPLQVALLSPAGRPVAVTGDLAGFWKGGWTDVRKDMRGRYPRHNWPEDPAAATPDPPKPPR